MVIDVMTRVRLMVFGVPRTRFYFLDKGVQSLQIISGSVWAARAVMRGKEECF